MSNTKQVFLGDFESGDTSQFTSASGTAQQSVVKSGAWSGKNTDNTNFRKDIAGSPTIFSVKADFQWDTTILNLWYVIVGVDQSNNDSFMIRTLTGGAFRIQLPNGNTYDTTATYSSNTWYNLRLDYKFSVQGYAMLYINNTLVASVTDVNTTNGVGNGKDMLKGVKWQGINATGNCYLDNCEIDILDPFPQSLYRTQGFQ